MFFLNRIMETPTVESKPIRPLRLVRRLLPVLPAAAIFWACNLEQSAPTEARHYLSLQLADSLTRYDTLRVTLITPKGDTLKVWSSKLDNADRLSRVEVRGYDGGDATLILTGILEGRVEYIRIVHYLAANGGSRIDSPALPDPGRPIVTIRPGVKSVDLGSVYLDPGADCLDEREGALSVSTAGTVNTGLVGRYRLTYSCMNSRNLADSAVRSVEVVETADTTAPVLTLFGGDMSMPFASPFTDPGGACVDDRDGSLMVSVDGTVDVSKKGDYILTYSCMDKALNRKTATRTVTIRGLSVIPSIKETSMDTSEYAGYTNTGFTPLNGFSGYAGDNFISVIQFDLAGISDRDRLASATAVFYTMGWDSDEWDDQPFHVTFRVNRITRAWTEGTGNWYYHDGGWQNGGDVLFANHPLRQEIILGSTNPGTRTGTTKDEKELFRRPNIVPVGSPQVKTLSYALGQSTSGSLLRPLPLGPAWVQIWLDLTEYVKSTPPEQDHGILITVEGMPKGKSLRYATKEMGDGVLRPSIFLEYLPDSAASGTVPAGPHE